ncbi:MAG: hypothetical protein QXX79_06100 [Candidatus Bathyarchaeia archaeon]
MENEGIAETLKTVPREKAFYFFTSIGNYTGESASSLTEFMDKINIINVKSLEFHFQRGDFEKWISEVLQDEELSEEFRNLHKLNLAGESLRSHLYATVLAHIKRIRAK